MNTSNTSGSISRALSYASEYPDKNENRVSSSEGKYLNRKIKKVDGHAASTSSFQPDEAAVSLQQGKQRRLSSNFKINYKNDRCFDARFGKWAQEVTNMMEEVHLTMKDCQTYYKYIHELPEVYSEEEEDATALIHQSIHDAITRSLPPVWEAAIQNLPASLDEGLASATSEAGTGTFSATKPLRRNNISSSMIEIHKYEPDKVFSEYDFNKMHAKEIIVRTP